jgi:hypothetical protein
MGKPKICQLARTMPVLVREVRGVQTTEHQRRWMGRRTTPRGATILPVAPLDHAIGPGHHAPKQPKLK